MRRGFHMTNRCILCVSVAESVNHLLHCEPCFLAWASFIFRFRPLQVQPPSIEALIVSQDRERVDDLSGRGKVLWFGVLTVVCWVIWREPRKHGYFKKVGKHGHSSDTSTWVSPACQRIKIYIYCFWTRLGHIRILLSNGNQGFFGKMIRKMV